MKQVTWTVNQPPLGGVVAPQVVVDEPTPWARSLLVGVRTHPSLNGMPNVTGNMVFQVVGGFTSGSWQRRFALGAGQQVEMDATLFDSIRVDVVYSNIPDLRCFARASERPWVGGERQIAPLPFSVSVGQHVVPWGGRRLNVATADAGFVWRGWEPTGGSTIDLPDPLAAGDDRRVKGPLFVTTVVLQGFWEIEL